MGKRVRKSVETVLGVLRLRQDFYRREQAKAEAKAQRAVQMLGGARSHRKVSHLQVTWVRQGHSQADKSPQGAGRISSLREGGAPAACSEADVGQTRQLSESSLVFLYFKDCFF